MPKKKHKARKANASSKTSGGAKTEKGSATEPVSAPKRTLRQRLNDSVMEMLYLRKAEGAQRLIRFFPLFGGAWISGGLILTNTWQFFLISLILILSYFAAHPEKRKQFVFSELLDWVFLAIIVAATLGLNLITNHPLFSLLAAGAGLLVYLSERLEITSPRSLLLLCATRVVEMSVFGVLGIYSQVLSRDIPSPNSLIAEFAIIGFSPGCCLAAAYVLHYIKVLEDAGWKVARTEEDTGKVRPSKIAQLYSLLLIAGPALPVMLIPIGVFPPSFFLLIMSIFPVSKLCQKFFDGEEISEFLFVKTINVAMVVSALVLFAALLAPHV